MGTPAQLVEAADHHFVPKFYLKGFTDNSKRLWVYEKGSNAPRESTPKNEGNIENYYTFADRGHPDDQAEKMLARVECAIAPVIRKLANPLFVINDVQRSELYSFVALTYVLVPAYRDFIDKQYGALMKRFTQDKAKDATAFAASLKEYEAKTGQSLGDHEKLREFAASDKYTVSQKSAGFNLLQIFRSSLTISEILETEYRHDIFYAPADMYFMTGDNPIVTIEPATDGEAFVGSGFGRPRTEVLFPLNKRACLILRRNGREQRIKASELRTRQVNELIMGVSQRFVYGSEGTRAIARMFNQHGCKIRYGENAFMSQPPPVKPDK
jgi:hypothetical protein